MGADVSWLFILQVLWPIAVTIIPLVLGAGFIWLKTQLATKAELTAATQGFETDLREVRTRLDTHADRFERGSGKFADHDKRIALVEESCESPPTRADLNQGLTVLGGRMSGVESSLRGLDRTVSTQNDYVRTLIEAGITKDRGK